MTISGITASDKTYDNTTAATVSVSGVVKTGLVLNDVVDVAATGVFSDENAASGKTVTLTSTYTGADVNNYTITSQASTTAKIIPLDVELPATANLTKVYDATTSITPTGYGTLALGTANNNSPYTTAFTADKAIVGGLTLAGRPVFSSAEAGNVTVDQGSVQLTGTRAANYRLVWVPANATITPAPLTVTANDDARFYSLADTAGYNGVRYSGFVGGQTSAVLNTTALTISRDRSVQLTADANSVDTQDAAGSYTSVLVPAGVTSNNYNITFASGKYTIVPAGQLLVKVANTSAIYGSAPVYTLTSAGYMGNGNQVTDLLGLGYATVSGALVTVTDGTNTVATFNGVTGLNLEVIKWKWRFGEKFLSYLVLTSALGGGEFLSRRTHGVHDRPAPAIHSARTGSPPIRSPSA